MTRVKPAFMLSLSMHLCSLGFFIVVLNSFPVFVFSLRYFLYQQQVSHQSDFAFV